MTGLYPYRTSMQRGSIGPFRPTGLPTHVISSHIAGWQHITLDLTRLRDFKILMFHTKC